MKYYAELSNLESEIIRLDSMQSLLRLISEGAHNNNEKDVINALWYITGSIEDINEKASQHFQDLWSQVREDSWQEDTTQFLKTNEYIKPSVASTEVNDIMNSWIRSEEC
jgi:hypothetical protein